MTDAFTDDAVKFIDEYGRKPDAVLPLRRLSPRRTGRCTPGRRTSRKYRGKYCKGWDALRKRAARAHDRDGHRRPQVAADAARPAGARLGDGHATRTSATCSMAVYAAQIDRMDQNIGRVLGEGAASSGRRTTR